MANQKPMTGEDLHKLLSESEHEHAVHAKEVKSDQLLDLLRVDHGDTDEKPVTEASPDKDKAPEESLQLPKAIEETDRGNKGNKYNFFSGKKPVESAPVTVPLGDPDKDENPDIPPEETGKKMKALAKPAPEKRERTANEDTYIPPSWQFNGGKTSSPIHSSQADVKKGPFFGIRLGTEFRAKLIRTTTNIEPTLTEFVVVDDVFGDFKMLQKNTKLYANKKVSNSSNRIYFNTVKGITPDGEEFEINATITDVSTNKLAGLAGAITTDNQLISRSASTGALAAGGEIVKQVASDNVLGAAATAAADSAMTEKEEEAKAKYGDPSFVIFVNPQDAFIRVDETF